MVSPLELTRLGVIERFQKLGSLKYILIAGLVSLVLGELKLYAIIATIVCKTRSIQIPIL
jgi:hypothetical protein